MTRRQTPYFANIYNLILAFLALSTLAMIATPALALDPAYHDPDEIRSFLNQIAEDFPEWVKVDSIGFSSEYQRPIWMAKLSDNPEQEEPEPSLLFIGQLHAEEIVGIEIVIELMQQLLNGLDAQAHLDRLEGLQLYFIPTANPEGLEVVYSGEDVTYRKNCRDNMGDGVFRCHSGAGWDTSGVDLNRNFGLHWDRGDSLFRDFGAPYVYNYYRGPQPFSEPESRALRDLALTHRFCFSACYHASRSGRDEEMVITPWTWDGRAPPDGAALNAIGGIIATLTPTANGLGHYFATNSSMMVGQSQDWFYQATGAFQYMIEVGDQIQPDSSEMRQIVADNLDAAFFLMDLALGKNAVIGYGMLGVVVRNAATGEPLSARIEINGQTDPVLEPRRSSSLTGRLDWMLPAGNCSVVIQKTGFETWRSDSVSIPSGNNTSLEVELEPAELTNCQVWLTDATTGLPLAGMVKVTNSLSEPQIFPIPKYYGHFALPPDVYIIEVISPNYLPAIEQVILERDSTSLTYNLNPAAIAYDEDFSADLGWQRGGTNEEWGLLSIGDTTCLTESRSGSYLPYTDAWLGLETGVQLDSLHGTLLEMIHRPYFDPGHDSGRVEAYQSRSGTWVELASYSQFPLGWDTLRVSLDHLDPGELILRLRVTSDSQVEEDGWLIDQITVYQADGRYAAPIETQPPAEFSMTICPNPANAMAIVTLTLPVAVEGELSLFDAAGRRIKTVRRGRFSAGTARILLDGSRYPSGIYFIGFNGSKFSSTATLNYLR